MKRAVKIQFATLKPWLLRVAALTFAVLMILMVAPHPYSAYAAEETILEKFDRVDVMTDLESATINGKPFDRNDFKPHDLYKSARLISLTEFCYGYHEDNRGDYGLYLYIYSPDGREIELESESNKLQIAVDYEGGLPVDYEKYALKICSVSEDNAFIKARVIDRPSDKTGKTILERVGRLKRRYDLSSVELHYKGDANARDFVIGGTFNFTGFAKGYGESHKADSTLDCTLVELFTVSLDVRNAFYRTGVSALGKDHQNEVNCVYFGVENELLKEYGTLQKIKAEWYEYKTLPIIVANDKDLVEALRKFVGKDIGKHTDELPYTLHQGYFSNTTPGGIVFCYPWGYNVDEWYHRPTGNEVIVQSRDTRIGGAFDTAGRDPKEYTLPAKELKEYIYTFNRFENGTLPVKNRTISADLFQDTVDSDRVRLFEKYGRKNGYTVQEIDARDEFDLKSYDDQHNWFQKFLEYGFWAPKTDEGYENVTPIYEVKESDLDLTGDTFEKSLLIDDRFEFEFKNYCKAAKLKDETTFIFRFAQTDYFSQMIDMSNGSEMIKKVGYRATQTVFLDFDILQLTFNRDGEYTVIPVVSSPIDIINDITPPLKDEIELPEWLKTLILVVLIILAVVVLLILLNFIPILKPVISLIFKAIGVVLKGVWFIFTLPFRGLYKLIQSIMAKAENST